MQRPVATNDAGSSDAGRWDRLAGPRRIRSTMVGAAVGALALGVLGGVTDVRVLMDARLRPVVEIVGVAVCGIVGLLGGGVFGRLAGGAPGMGMGLFLGAVVGVGAGALGVVSIVLDASFWLAVDALGLAVGGAMGLLVGRVGGRIAGAGPGVGMLMGAGLGGGLGAVGVMAAVVDASFWVNVDAVGLVVDLALGLVLGGVVGLAADLAWTLLNVVRNRRRVTPSSPPPPSLDHT